MDRKTDTRGVHLEDIRAGVGLGAEGPSCGQRLSREGALYDIRNAVLPNEYVGVGVRPEDCLKILK